MIVVLVVPTIYSYKFIRAYDHYEKAVEPSTITEQLIYLQLANDNAPWNVDLKEVLAQAYAQIYLQTGDEEFLDRMNTTIRRMVELEPENIISLYTSIQLLEITEQKEWADELTDHALALDRFNAQLYEKAIQLKAEKALHEKSIESAIEAFEIYKINVERYETVLRKIWKEKLKDFNSRDFTVTDQAKFYTALSCFITGKDEWVLNLLSEIESVNEELSPRIEALKTVVYKKKGDKQGEKIYNLHKNNEEYLNYLQLLEKWQDFYTNSSSEI